MCNIFERGKLYMDLIEIMENLMTSNEEAPIASGICSGHMKGMLDCNDVDGNCSTVD